jgi:predicted ATPase/class 3 adenylate cyclase
MKYPDADENLHCRLTERLALSPRSLSIYDRPGGGMRELPIGTVTFLFTDIEGSTRLLQRLGDRYRAAIDRHGEILREAIFLGGGTEVGTEGDAFFAAFPTSSGALVAAVHAQRTLAAEAWPEGLPVRVRMGLHTGAGVPGGDSYIGLDVHLAARIAAAGHGGQVLLSDATRRLVERALPDGVSLRDLGRHRLKDIERPEHLYDLLIDGLATEFPAIKTLDARPTNLPPQRTSFVGREREVAEASALLAATRLVTLTGPGGTGKTRLALKVASDHLDRFSDGVFFVDLSPITDPALVPSVVAQALMVRDEPGRDPLDTLTDHLRDRTVLLLLDNMEQVIEAGVAVSRLLDSAPGLTVLATSRAPIRISGERAYQVAPMPVPDLKQAFDLELITRSEAVALFAERAAAVRHDFRVTAENAAAVAEITARLDGLPLAIELGASRLNVLSVETLLARLTERLPLLTGGARDLSERQQTLRGTIEWSHNLLGPEEKRLFARLSVFAGGWDLKAADAVCGPGLDLDVLDGSSALVDTSLIRRVEVEDGEPRFTMLETIREYATEQLASSEEQPEIRRRHAEHFRDLAERYDPGFFFRIGGPGKEQGDRSLHLDREHDNLRAALSWAVEGGDVATGLRTAGALNWYWQHRGHFADGRGWLERLLSIPDSAAEPAVRIRALLALGDASFLQGDRGAAERAWREAVDLAREVGNRPLLAWSLLDLADIPTWTKDYDGAEALLTESLAAAKDGGDQILASEIGAVLGRLAYFRGDIATAGERYRQAVASQRELGADRFLAINVARLADVEVELEEFDAAEAHYRESLAKVNEAGNVVVTAIMLVYLAWLASRRSDPRRAARLLGAASRISDEIGGGPTRERIPVWPEAEDGSRKALGDETFEATRAEGYAMSTEEAATYALETPVEGGPDG